MKRSGLKRRTPLRNRKGLERGGKAATDKGEAAGKAAFMRTRARSTLKQRKRLAPVGARERRNKAMDDAGRAEVKTAGCICGCGAVGAGVDWAHLDGRAGSRHKPHLYIGLHRSLHEWLDGHRGSGGPTAKRELRELAKATGRRPTTDEFWEVVERHGCPERRPKKARWDLDGPLPGGMGPDITVPDDDDVPF